ncbi:hypothetical protein E2C01_023256 [Portunus trituberculatus]|uniref:Uncharacterized protein n=1 Tax=Portunus trituberculatus TaxID=210409 RepID=A0A5B7E7I4_PORTR|nr:hypothetical protein [Portunus trituberculatus]
MRAVVLKPLVGVVTQSAATRLLGGALSVDRHCCHSWGRLRRRACCNGRRRGRCCSPKLVRGIGGGQHPTHCSLAQQTTTGTQCGALKSLSLPPLGRNGAPPQTVMKVTVLLDPVTSAVAPRHGPGHRPHLTVWNAT